MRKLLICSNVRLQKWFLAVFGGIPSDAGGVLCFGNPNGIEERAFAMYGKTTATIPLKTAKNRNWRRALLVTSTGDFRLCRDGV
jgi:hypothetical protein